MSASGRKATLSSPERTSLDFRYPPYGPSRDWVFSAPASLGATVCFSKLELTLRGLHALFLAVDAVVLPLHTRH
jgi:hypothetical protein